MRTLGRTLLLAALVPVVYVAEAATLLPLVTWHRSHDVGESALMRIRAAEARREARPWEIRHRWVPRERISPHLARAVIVGEDTRFREHRGFDWEQIREAWENVRAGGRLRGASTITQQTAKNLYLSPSRNPLRKAREAVLTAWMESVVPKDRILELYLNVVEFGPGVFGAEAASRRYFGRSAAGLSRSQAALLAATLPAPLARNPSASTPGLRRRQEMILDRMWRWYEGGGDDAAVVGERDTAAASEDGGTRPADPGDRRPVERRPSEAIPLDDEPGGP